MIQLITANITPPAWKLRLEEITTTPNMTFPEKLQAFGDVYCEVFNKAFANEVDSEETRYRIKEFDREVMLVIQMSSLQRRE